MRISDWSSDVCSSDLLICDPVDDRPRSPATATLMSKTLMPRIDVQAENQRMDNIHAGSCLCGAVHYQVDGAFEQRSEQRRVGNECVSTVRSQWSQSHLIKKNIYIDKIHQSTIT